jgi:Tol biopolymer transport system component
MTERPPLSDAILKDALSRRATGPSTPLELAADVRAAVETIPQGTGWRWRFGARPQWLPVAVLTLLMLSAVVGYALVVGGAVIVPQSESGDIVFVRATYGWSAEGIAVGDRWMYSMDADGGRLTLLAEVPGVELRQVEGRLVGRFGTSGPAVQLSPDGRRIAFRLFNDSAGLYVMNRDGTELSRLVHLPQDVLTDYIAGGGPEPMAAGLAWSPDGTQIAFTYPLYSAYSDVLIVDSVTGQMRRVTDDGSGGADGIVAWSPNGLALAFARRSGFDDESTAIIVNEDGTGEGRLDRPDDAAAFIGKMAWSPSGERIAFVRMSPGIGVEVVVDKSDGSVEHRVARFGCCPVRDTRTPLAWSPDGSRIAWVFNGIIWITQADGSGDSRLTRGESPDWSPDGSQLVFSRPASPIRGAPDQVAGHSIFVINADGTGLRWLADGEYPVWEPAPGSGD